MSDKKISQLTASTVPLAGTEVLPIVQSSVTKKVSIDDLTKGKPVYTGGLYSNTTDTSFYETNAGGNVGAFFPQLFTGGGTNVNVGTGFSNGDTTSAAVWWRLNDASKRIKGADIYSAWTSTVAGNESCDLVVRVQQNGGGTVEAIRFKSNQDVSLAAGNLVIGTSGKGVDFGSSVLWRTGSGSPEGVVTAAPGSMYTNTAGGAGATLYVKESGTGNTGWVAK